MSKKTLFKIPILFTLVSTLLFTMAGCAEHSTSKEDKVEINTTNHSQDMNSSSPNPFQSYEEYIGVNYMIDIAEWEQFLAPENEADYVFVVNEANPLSSHYEPTDLQDVYHTRNGYPMQTMIGVAEMALRAFLLEAVLYEIEGMKDVSVTNAYRSYSMQKSKFDSQVHSELNNFPSRSEAEKYVSTFLRPPGTSEHQTGLAIDMHNLPAANQSFGNTEAGKWLADNAHRFGFILSFPEGKTEITGVIYEPWHFRYVGRTAATEIYKLGMCLDEYVIHIQNNSSELKGTNTL